MIKVPSMTDIRNEIIFSNKAIKSEMRFLRKRIIMLESKLADVEAFKYGGRN